MFKQCFKPELALGDLDINPDRFTKFSQIKDILKQIAVHPLDIVIYFDFSRSNLINQQKSLQHTDSLNNPYIIALKAILTASAELDSNRVFHAYRFGCVDSKHKRVVPLLGDQAKFTSSEELMGAYFSALKTTILSGPTQISTCIDSMITHCQQFKEHTIGVILTNSPSQSITKDFNSVIQASYFPISICCIGVGDANFDSLEFLDDCEGRKFDNFQFFHLDTLSRKYQSKDFAQILCCKTFMELPDQYVRCQNLGYHDELRACRIVKEHSDIFAEVQFGQEFIREKIEQSQLLSLE
ncbi:Copine I [Spironucleus salmonicida]|uniref:Copine I n=1 Tax=Spironucleus salmonicida TaxID=348837 RepID=V6LQE8_9EUKA|nr:Copine I [Spironucleus salmonicida]|eukprot:EST46473.1 Copine I [Spironucleus salmonicida]